MTRACDIASSFATKVAEKAAEWLVDAVRARVERETAEREASRARWRELMDQARAGTWPPGETT